jgi:hypothetical protein
MYRFRRKRVGVSSKLKQYIQGMLLLMLATFIISSVQYLVSITPETVLSSGSTSGTTETYVTSVTSTVREGYQDPAYCGGVSPCTRVKAFISLDAPPSGKKYKAYLELYGQEIPLTSSHVKNVTVISGGNEIFLPFTALNDTWIVTEFNCSISEIRIYHTISSSYTTRFTAYIYLATIPQPSFSISNKVILSFIAWITGIAIIISALHKFDIWI